MCYNNARIIFEQMKPRCCYHALPRISALPFLIAAVLTTVGVQAALAHLFRQSLKFLKPFTYNFLGFLACLTLPYPSSWPAGRSSSSPRRWWPGPRSSRPQRSTWLSTRRRGAVGRRLCWELWSVSRQLSLSCPLFSHLEYIELT